MILVARNCGIKHSWNFMKLSIPNKRYARKFLSMLKEMIKISYALTVDCL